MKKILQSQKAFTLIEVAIAFALSAVVIFSVYLVQSNSLFFSVRTRNVAVATTLARNMLVKSEVELRDKDFGLLKDKESGAFPAPDDRFTWTREIKETDFSALSEIIAANVTGDKSEESSGITQGQNLVIQTLEDYMKQSIRHMTITVEWPEGEKSNSISFTTFLVRYDAKINPGI